MEEPVDAIVAYLSIATRGVIILAHGAEDFQLRSLLRALLPQHPDVQICLEPAELEAVPVGSVVILCPAPEHAPILNAGRPLVADRDLKLVLWCSEETTLALSRQAPDFYDWISHVVELPKTVPGFVVAGLRAAAARGATVHWRGPQPLEVALSAAGQTIAVRAGRGPLPKDSVASAGEAATGWLVLDQRETPFLSDVEARLSRAGRPVAIIGKRTPKLSWSIHGRPYTLREACKDQGASGAAWRRLCIALELEPESVDIARHAGIDEDYFAILLAARDPGALAASLGILRENGSDDERSDLCARLAADYVRGELSPPLLRALFGRQEDLAWSSGVFAAGDLRVPLAHLRVSTVKIAALNAAIEFSRRLALSIAVALADIGDPEPLQHCQHKFAGPDETSDAALAQRIAEARLAMRAWYLDVAHDMVSEIEREIPESWGHMRGLTLLLNGQIEARKGRHAAAAALLLAAVQKLAEIDHRALFIDLARASLELALLPDRVDVTQASASLGALTAALGESHPDVVEFRERLAYARRVADLRASSAA